MNRKVRHHKFFFFKNVMIYHFWCLCATWNNQVMLQFGKGFLSNKFYNIQRGILKFRKNSKLLSQHLNLLMIVSFFNSWSHLHSNFHSSCINNFPINMNGLTQPHGSKTELISRNIFLLVNIFLEESRAAGSPVDSDSAYLWFQLINYIPSFLPWNKFKRPT